MQKKNVKVLISRFLLLALFGSPVLMIGPIDEAGAEFRHVGECKEIYELKGEVGSGGTGVSISIRIECQVTYHWHFGSHEDDSSGSCDSEGPDWCDFCQEEHWVCNYGTGW